MTRLGLRQGMGPPRMLFATTVVGTADAFLETTAIEAGRRGWEVHLLTNLEGSASRERPYTAVHHVGWGRGFASPRGTLAAFSQVRRLLGSGGFAVVHTHTPTASAMVRLAVLGQSPRPRVVYTAHGLHFGDGLDRWPNRVAEVVERLLLPSTDTLIVINAEDERWARQHAGPRTRVVRTKGVGLRADFLSAARAAPSAVDGREGLSGERVVAFIGELIPRKQPFLALDAVARLRGVRRRLVVVGDGPLRDEVTVAARELANADPTLSIDMLGRRSDVPRLLAEADVLVHTAAQEGLPTVVLEAMAMGVPVAAFDIRGCRDLLSGGGGLLVPRGDVEALADAVRRLATDATAAAEARRLGRRTAQTYDRRTLAAEACDLYADVVRPS